MQTRVCLQDTVVGDYAAAMAEGVEFPAVTLFTLDRHDFFIGDGFHRVSAARENGASDIEADVYEGDATDALVYALGANGTHGLQRTPADKRRAVELALQQPELAARSSRAIAKICGVSHTLVDDVRSNLAAAATSLRTGLDGKVYPKRAGRTSAAETESAEEIPDASPPLTGAAVTATNKQVSVHTEQLHKNDVITRIGRDVVSGLEPHAIATLERFHAAVVAWKADWFTTEGSSGPDGPASLT